MTTLGHQLTTFVPTAETSPCSLVFPGAARGGGMVHHVEPWSHAPAMVQPLAQHQPGAWCLVHRLIPVRLHLHQTKGQKNTSKVLMPNSAKVSKTGLSCTITCYESVLADADAYRVKNALYYTLLHFITLFCQ